MASYTLQDIISIFGGQVLGDASVSVSRVATLISAQAGDISFIHSTRYQSALLHSRASAVVMSGIHSHLTNTPRIVTNNPYAYFAKVARLLNPEPPPVPGIAPSAVIDRSACIPKSVTVAAGAIIGCNVLLGENVVIGQGVVLGNDVQIGDNSCLDAGVIVQTGCIIGNYCHIFPGVVIGADGFGYADAEDGWVKIPQLGRVIIHDCVDIGANTTIDRGTLDDTVIGKGVKLDNLVQIAHNVTIGEHTVIAACAGIAGSAKIGARCQIGGAAMIAGHLKIADDVVISPGTMIPKSLLKAGRYTALMPFQEHGDWLNTAANLRHMHEIKHKIRVLEARLNALSHHIDNKEKP